MRDYLAQIVWAEPTASDTPPDWEGRIDRLISLFRSLGGRLRYWHMRDASLVWLIVVEAASLDVMTAAGASISADGQTYGIEAYSAMDTPLADTASADQVDLSGTDSWPMPRQR